MRFNPLINAHVWIEQRNAAILGSNRFHSKTDSYFENYENQCVKNYLACTLIPNLNVQN